MARKKSKKEKREKAPFRQFKVAAPLPYPVPPAKLQEDEDPPEKREEDEPPPDERDYLNAESCNEHIRQSIPHEDRVAMARRLGPNWACIMSGMGDQ